jgi:hypothetical protein
MKKVGRSARWFLSLLIGVTMAYTTGYNEFYFFFIENEEYSTDPSQN